MQGDFARKELGRAGEETASEFLKKEGFRVLERNYRSRWGEVDLIVEKGVDLFFVEVKSRRSVDDVSPLELIPHSKQVRLSRMAQHYFASKTIRDRAGRFALLIVDYSHETPICELITDIFDLAWGY